MQTSTFDFPYQLPSCSEKNIVGDILFLDVETTGFSPDMSALFMIGCGWFDGEHLHIMQWLSDSLELYGERDILSAFSDFLKKRIQHSPDLRLITYNGQTFDLPFLHTRYLQCGLENPLKTMDFATDPLDLYRCFSPYKSLWPVPDMKLKTMAGWLGFKPSKAPSGRHLIKAYQDYIKTKDSETLNLLFLHNQEDLISLVKILPICNYFRFFNGAYTFPVSPVIEETQLTLTMKPEVCLPAPLDWEAFGFHLDISPDIVHLQIPLYPQGLRYYYTDFKNYIYLPVEDYAVHKSMMSYIDRSHWEKARRENCYNWFSLDETFIKDTHRQQEYIKMIFCLFGFFGEKPLS